MNIQIFKISLKVLPFFTLFALLLFASHAGATLVVEGDQQFTDEVNECIITYSSAPGIVGEVIRELENSSNEHKIINDPSWCNAIYDRDAAFGGEGCGSVTKVDREKLNDYIEKFPELANKDFCTALLHELWHAVDADRGEWSRDRIDGVKRSEVEATTFQNFVHAIRGVPPRTAYGGVNITVLQSEVVPTASMSFAHVSPGVYSEVYATVTTAPGATVDATLSGPGVSGTAAQSKTADENGTATFTWRIVYYGTYTLEGTSNGYSFSSSVNVN